MWSESVDPGSTGISKAQQLGNLVKGLAGRIVHRGAYIPVTFLLHQVQVGMTAGNHKRQRPDPRIEGFSLGQQHSVNVTLQVVDRDERFIHRKSQRFGVSHTHQQSSGKSRPLGHRDSIQIGEGQARFSHGPTGHRHNIAQMFPRGELGNDSPIRQVNGVLRSHDARSYVVPALHHGGRGLVAGTFDA
jgi:hypothetical protein